jgi:hypothetical protein
MVQKGPLFAQQASSFAQKAASAALKVRLAALFGRSAELMGADVGQKGVDVGAFRAAIGAFWAARRALSAAVMALKAWRATLLGWRAALFDRRAALFGWRSALLARRSGFIRAQLPRCAGPQKGKAAQDGLSGEGFTLLTPVVSQGRAMSKSSTTLLFVLIGVAFCSLSAPADGFKPKSGESALYGRGIFERRLDLGKPIEVGVVDPAGHFSFLLADRFRCPGTTYKKGVLKIDIRNAVGMSSVTDTGTARAVFQMAGKYKILASDNLETELKNSYSSVFELTLKKADTYKVGGNRAIANACVEVQK